MPKHTHEHDPAHDTKGAGPGNIPADAENRAGDEAAESPAKEPEAGTGGGASAFEAFPAGDSSGKKTDNTDKIADLEAKLAEVNDQYLRKAADFENFRKRMVREKQEAIDYANQSLLLDLIQTMDDFERAIKAAESMAESSPAFKTFFEGVSMIARRLSSQLENKWALKKFDSAGQAFDPNRHEAMMMEKSADISEPVVQEEFSKGYTLKDRVVRSAQVKVLMPSDPAGGSSGNQAESGAGSAGDETQISPDPAAGAEPAHA